MSSTFKRLLLPAAFLLTFSAQECGSPDQVDEEITVNADGSVDVDFMHKARDFEDLLDSEPPPSLEAGWDSVHVGTIKEGKEDRPYLRAWRRFPAGAALPQTFAQPDDPLQAWYVRFPTELSTEMRGDTLLFRFQRNYPPFPWNPAELLEDRGEKIDSAGEELTDLLEEKRRTIEEEWERSGLLEQAEATGDSGTLRRYQREFRDLLESGDPSVLERTRRIAGDWMLFSILNNLAFAIPAGEQVCREADPNRAVELKRLLLDVVVKPEAPAVLVWDIMLLDFDLEPDSAVFPELTAEGPRLGDDDPFQAQTAEMLTRFREAILLECGLDAKGLVEFHRRFDWLSERFEMSEGEIRNRRFQVRLTMPGELVATNADTLAAGVAEWRFSIRDLFEKEIRLVATSRLVHLIP